MMFRISQQRRRQEADQVPVLAYTTPCSVEITASGGLSTNVTSNWLAAVLTANEESCWKTAFRKTQF